MIQQIQAELAQYSKDQLIAMWIRFGHNDDCITNAQNAIDSMVKADPDFQYVYVTYKGLPPSVKDDFYNMKDLMDKNLIYIRSLQDGLDKNTLQNWMDNDKKINNSYHSIKLEIERIQH